jgi:hypothetical protein
MQSSAGTKLVFGFQCSALPLAAEAVSLIGKETLKKRISNIEQGISNVEGMNSVNFRQD